MTRQQDIPFVDLQWQHSRIAEEVMEGIERVIATTSFVLGREVAYFEEQFASYCGVDHVVGVANGTDAIELALRGHDVGFGDEVILPANSFVATAEAVARTGARPVLVDCGQDFLIDPSLLPSVLNDRTRAVIPVHLFGQMAEIERIRDIVGPEVAIIEDAAQAQGAERWGHRAGSVGDAAATSFYPGKNLGAYGDAGAVMTKSKRVADRVRALRNHGGVAKYEHVEIGFNSRLDAIQAAVLSVKLAKLDEWNCLRSLAATRYRQMLGEHPAVRIPNTIDGNVHVWHLYVVRVPDRDRVLAELSAAGIGSGVHYPKPIHLLPAFGFLGYRIGEFKMAEQLAGEILSLPIYPGISHDQQEAVVVALVKAVEKA